MSEQAHEVLRGCGLHTEACSSLAYVHCWRVQPKGLNGCACRPVPAVLRVESEAFQSASVALGQMKAAMPAALEAPPAVPSVPATPDGIPAGNIEATPPQFQVGSSCLVLLRG